MSLGRQHRRRRPATGSATTRPTWAPGRSSSSAGWNYGEWPFYEVAQSGRSPSTSSARRTYTKQAQALFVVLPDKQVPLELGAPFAGDFYYSRPGRQPRQLDDEAVTLPAGAYADREGGYQIETDWDYAYVVVSTDGGATWTPVATNRSTNTEPERPELRQRHHRQLGRQLGRPDRRPPAYAGQTSCSASATGRTARSSSQASQVDDIAITGSRSTAPRPHAAGRSPANGFRARPARRRSRSSTPTSPSTASTAATTRPCKTGRTTSAS